jgi:hypothetical protein
MLVKLNGVVATEPQKLTNYKGVVLYECFIKNTRKSGVCDNIRITYTDLDIHMGDLVYLEGELRANKLNGRTTLYIHTAKIDIVDDISESINEVSGSGVICRDINIREAGDNTIADVTLKCTRNKDKYSYVYCSVWNRMTRYINQYKVGDTLSIIGRLQSHYRGDVLVTEVSIYRYRKEDTAC